MNLEALLRGVGMFAGLNGRQIARLARLATSQEFPAGTRIVRRGETGVALYLIAEGRVVITLPSEGAAKSADGEQILGEMGPGEVFGEIALIDEGPRSADVTTVEETRCVLLTRWDFEEAMRRDPQIARALLPILCARIRSLQERLIRYEAEPTTD